MNIIKCNDILNKINYMSSDLDFLITSRCNQRCFYCDFPNIQSPTDITVKDLDNIEMYLDYCINKIITEHHNKSIGLIGGELGVLSNEILTSLLNLYEKYAIKYSFQNMYWYTNGYLLQTFPNIINNKYITVNYHILDIELETFKPIIANNIIYNIVLTEQNKKQVDKIKQQFSNIQLSIKPCNNIRIQNVANMENIKYYNKFNKNYCNNNSLFFQLDFTNYTIIKCCRSYTRFERKELNFNNIDLAFKGLLFKPSNLCQNCSW